MTKAKTVTIDDVTFERRESTLWVALDDDMAVGYETMGYYTCSILDAYVEALDEKETLAQQNQDLLQAVERLMAERDETRNHASRLSLEAIGIKLLNEPDLAGDNPRDSESTDEDVRPELSKRSDYKVYKSWRSDRLYIYYLGEIIGYEWSSEAADRLIERHMLLIQDDASRQARPAAPGERSGMSGQERKELLDIVETLQETERIHSQLAHVIRRILVCMT